MLCIRLQAAVLAWIVACGAALGQAADPPTDRFPTAAQSYVVAIDGDIRWARALDVALPPASLTKILTALIVLEDHWTPSAVVTVSARAADVEGTRLHLHEGDRLTAADALTATLVRSANDACLALAEYNAGSIEQFVSRMNAKAQTLGLTNTHFANPCGLDQPTHKSSAHDLLRLATIAMRNSEFVRIVSLPNAQVRTLDGRAFSFHNNNALIGRLPGAIGVKSGFTTGAGKCVIVWAVRERVQVAVVLLNSQDRWWTAAGMVEQAFLAAQGRLAHVSNSLVPPHGG